MKRMKRRDDSRNPKLVLHQETLRRLDQDDLRLAVGVQSAASVCQENTKPMCGTWTLVGSC